MIKKQVQKSILSGGLIMALVFMAFAMGHAQTLPSILPQGIEIKEAFQPGYGMAIGRVQIITGKAVVIHADQTVGYYLAEDKLLFKDDTIVTFEKGRLAFIMNDGSILTLSSLTKLTLNRSVFDPEKSMRSAYVKMEEGKARFWVKKFLHFKSEFKVKTKTMIAGVRGSDFIIKASQNRTEVITLGHTRLEVISLIAPEQPAVMSDFEKISVEKDSLPSDILKMSPADIDRVIREISIQSRSVDTVELTQVKPLPERQGPQPETGQGQQPPEKGETLAQNRLDQYKQGLHDHPEGQNPGPRPQGMPGPIPKDMPLHGPELGQGPEPWQNNPQQPGPPPEERGPIPPGEKDYRGPEPFNQGMMEQNPEEFKEPVPGEPRPFVANMAGKPIIPEAVVQFVDPGDLVAPEDFHKIVNVVQNPDINLNENWQPQAVIGIDQDKDIFQEVKEQLPGFPLPPDRHRVEEQTGN